jgi:hypothetical protein
MALPPSPPSPGLLLVLVLLCVIAGAGPVVCLDVLPCLLHPGSPPAARLPFRTQPGSDEGCGLSTGERFWT